MVSGLGFRVRVWDMGLGFGGSRFKVFGNYTRLSRPQLLESPKPKRPKP